MQFCRALDNVSDFFENLLLGEEVFDREVEQAVLRFLRYTKRRRLLGRVCVHGRSGLMLRGRSLWDGVGADTDSGIGIVLVFGECSGCLWSLSVLWWSSVQDVAQLK